MSFSGSEPSAFLTLYFQVHQPLRLRPVRFFDIGAITSYFDEVLNRKIMQQVATNCYLPANYLLLRLIRRYPQIRITFSISGVALEQFEKYAPEVLDSFRMLAATGAVEFLGETYYHSLACQVSRHEFLHQADLHRQKMNELLGVQPQVFRNTELIYSDAIGRLVKQAGFRGIFIEGHEHVLGNADPNRLYRHPDRHGPVLFPRNYRLSDDIAFRFSEKNWSEWPLRSRKYFDWLEQIPGHQPVVTLGMDYETFGEHHHADTGIFQFLKGLLFRIATQSARYKMITPSDALDLDLPAEVLSLPQPVSWADRERDLSAWLGNDMQEDAFESLKRLERDIKKTDHPALTRAWRYLQTSDHFYYMSVKDHDDGTIHAYFSPYPSPYQAFINYMNVLTDLSMQTGMLRKYVTRSAAEGPTAEQPDISIIE